MKHISHMHTSSFRHASNFIFGKKKNVVYIGYIGLYRATVILLSLLTINVCKTHIYARAMTFHGTNLLFIFILKDQTKHDLITEKIHLIK